MQLVKGENSTNITTPWDQYIGESPLFNKKLKEIKKSE